MNKVEAINRELYKNIDAVIELKCPFFDEYFFERNSYRYNDGNNEQNEAVRKMIRTIDILSTQNTKCKHQVDIEYSGL